MYPLTIGLAIENRDLWEQAQSCLADLPFRIIVEHQDIGDLSNFLDRLERMRPDVVLIDISGWKEPLEGLVTSIRGAIGDPMIIALNTSAEAQTILSSLRAGVNEYLFPPLQESLKKALEKRSAERSRRRDGAKGAGKSFAFLSAKGGCGATTIVCHVAQELGRQNQKVLLTDLDLDAGMVGFITKTKAVYSILDAVNNLHRLDISYWKALVSNGIPGVEIVAAPLALASKQQPKDDQVRHVLAFARPHYDWTLVDLGRGLSRLAMAALEEIDEVCLVTTLEVPALHQSKQIVQTLLDSGYGKARIRLVLNRAPKRLDITPGELEKMLGIPIFAMVPNDYPELYETYAEGRMLNHGSDLGKQIAKLAVKLAGLEDEKAGKKKFGLFG
ncbi:Response regulator receiver protein [Candidatus Sulfopaludibacter sp. SbA4]|nr:Response regulator receiver protein [Candidatus Sulfopaludibacter sp. SbA4]